MAASLIQLTFHFLSLILLTGSLIEAKTVSYILDVAYVEGAPDGVYKESILSINGQFPGPTIEAEVGDVLEVFLVNSIQDGQNVSLHWHGIHQRDSQFEDGTSQITQCPLKNGHTMRYVFPLSQAGTYWYHSHVNSQYTEGLWGALLVHNRPEVYEYDGEILITLNDWYHRTARENEEWYLSTKSDGAPPYPDSALINAVGRYPCNFAALQNRTCDGELQSRAVFQVSREKTYRVRVINVAALATFNFSIDGHTLETIEVDGTDVAQPISTGFVSVSIGERYSFLIRTTGPLDRSLIRANVRTELLYPEGNINEYPEALIPDLTAVLEYSADDGNSSSPRVGTEPHSYEETVPPVDMSDANFLNQDDLTPNDGVYAPATYDQEFVLSIETYVDAEGTMRRAFNGTHFVLPHDKPLLMSLLEGEPIPESAFPLEIGYNNVIQVVINTPLGSHPFHIHGHSFWVLGSGLWGEGDYDPKRHNLTLTGARRDTVFVQENSWAVIRFVADNPGIWTFHCHIDWHNLSGMALTFIEGRDEAMRNIKVTSEAERVCGLWHE